MGKVTFIGVNQLFAVNIMLSTSHSYYLTGCVYRVGIDAAATNARQRTRTCFTFSFYSSFFATGFILRQLYSPDVGIDLLTSVLTVLNELEIDVNL